MYVQVSTHLVRSNLIVDEVLRKNDLVSGNKQKICYIF
jgi:hypothetical protein